MLKNLNTDNALNAQNLQVALFAFAIGLVSYATLKKLFGKKYKYPEEIDFKKDKQLGANKREFLENLQNDHEKYLELLQKLYPGECTLTLGCNKKLVFLNTVESVKKFSKKGREHEPIADKPKSLLLNFVSKGYLGSFFRMFDDKLLEIRKSSLAGLHRLIGSDPDFESKLTEEFQLLIDFFNQEFIDSKTSSEKENLGKSFLTALGKDQGLVENAPIYLQQITTNIITSIGLGVRFDYDSNPDSAIKQQMNHISEALNSLNMPNIMNFTFWDTYLKKDTLNYLAYRVNSVYDFLLNAIVGYKASYEPDVLRTFADYVISKQTEKMATGKKIKDDDNYSDKDILVQVFTLLMAGTCTTGFTLSWALYYLAKNQKVQNEIYEEIVRNTGTGALITSKQRINLPYTEACINEILRLSSTQALIGRSTNEEVNVDSYSLPKNTTVFINSYAIHRDPKYWPSKELNPDQWFDENKNLKTFLESYLPFGVSPRTCIGDSLSKLILFLVISNFVQRYHFEYVGDKAFENMSGSGNLGVMRRPYTYHLKISRRA